MLSVLFCGAGAILIVYWLISTVSIGSVAFTNVLLGVGAVCVIAGILERRFGQLPGVLTLKKFLLPVLIAALAGFAVLETLILVNAAREDDTPADYVLVLGAGLRGDQPSLTLMERLDAALERDTGGIFVVSGGQGPNEAIPEAEAMARYLMEHGIPEERILKESKSTSTMENLRYSREMIEQHSGREISALRVKIISSDFHAFRIRMLARRAGYGQVSVSGAKTPAMAAPSCYIREVFALVKSFLLDH